MKGFGKSVWSYASVVCAVLCMLSSEAVARGGRMPGEDRWASAHIDNLPPEIRHAIVPYAPICGGSLAAEHQFSTYFKRGQVRLVALHFERLRCGDKTPICTARGCLHQVYISNGGRYRLLSSSYVPEIDLTQVMTALH